MNMKKLKQIKVDGKTGYLLKGGRPPKNFTDSGARYNNKKIYVRR